MAKKKLTEEQEREIKLLQASNEMMERTKEEAKLRGKTKSIQRIEIAQDDIKAQLNKFSTAQIEAVEEKENKADGIINAVIIDDDDDDIATVIENANKKKQEEADIKKIAQRSRPTETVIEENTDEDLFEGIPSDVQYDVISLPSNGECYKNKTSRVQVSYLTAYDENFITSPNLYKDGLVIDFLLKHKVLNKNFDVDSLCVGDVDAIILFLRATSYGADFPVTVKDPKSGELIDTTVDLTQFKSKEFNLEGDENGWFDFTLPISKDDIKFRFLTRRDEKNLNLLSQLEKDGSKSILIKNAHNTIANAMRSDNILTREEKTEIEKSLEVINKWSATLKESTKTPFSKMITNRMEMNIMAVNGNTDRKYIHKYVKNMLAKDSLDLRKYILENEPGMNWEFEVDRPENLGGGSFKTFLQWDDTVFLNIP